MTDADAHVDDGASEWATIHDRPEARALGMYMDLVSRWVSTHSDRAKPFLARGVVRVQHGEVLFHKQRLGEMFIEFLTTGGNA